MPCRFGTFGSRLAAIAVIALAIRVAFTLAIASGSLVGVGGDGVLYHQAANLLATGHGYVLPPSADIFRRAPRDHADRANEPTTARHPPLWPFVLAGASKLGGTSYTAHRLVGCLLGAIVVALLGVLGRQLGGDRVGLVTAGVGSVYPFFVSIDASLMSESLYGVLIASALVLAYRLLDRPTAGRAAVLGVAIGLAALTRAEALLLVPVLALPVSWRSGQGRGTRAAVACLGVMLVVAPWSLRNWVALDRPVLVSTGYGGVLAGANCPATYAGRDLGSWNVECALLQSSESNEATAAVDAARDSLDYARDHAGRLPSVIAVRILRTWDLYQPFRVSAFAWVKRETWTVWAENLMYYLLLPFAAAGVVLLRRRGEPLSILLAPMILAILTSILFYGLSRFRYPAEIPLVVLAGTGLANAGRLGSLRLALRRRRRPSATG